MSEYKARLQMMLLRPARPESAPYQRLYAVCEFAAYAALAAGYLAAIAAHI